MDRFESLDVGELPPQVGDLLAGGLEAAFGSRPCLGERDDLVLQAIGEPGILLGAGLDLGELLRVATALGVEGGLQLRREARPLGFEGFAMPGLERLAGEPELFDARLAAPPPATSAAASCFPRQAELLGELVMLPGLGFARVVEGPAQVVDLGAEPVFLVSPLAPGLFVGLATAPARPRPPAARRPAARARPPRRELSSLRRICPASSSSRACKEWNVSSCSPTSCRAVAFGVRRSSWPACRVGCAAALHGPAPDRGRSRSASRRAAERSRRRGPCRQLLSEAPTLGVGFPGRMLEHAGLARRVRRVRLRGFELFAQGLQLTRPGLAFGVGVFQGPLELLELLPHLADLVPGGAELLVTLHQGLGKLPARGQLGLEGLQLPA